MAKTTIEKIESIQVEIQQPKNQKKQLLQQQKEQDHKDRTQRLCSRHGLGLLEKYMPDLITVTDEQFEMFIKKAIDTSYGRNILAEIRAKTEVLPYGEWVDIFFIFHVDFFVGKVRQYLINMLD